MHDRQATVRFIRIVLICWTVAVGFFAFTPVLQAENITREHVLTSIEKAKHFLLQQQQPDGTWQLAGHPEQTVVLTSFTLHTLLHAGMMADNAEIQRGLQWLRKQDPVKTHEISLMLETLAAAREAERDLPLMNRLTQKLEAGKSRGTNDGAWSFGGGETSNYAHFAALGLYEAAQQGVPVQTETWQRARNHWLGRQNRDGGWGSQGSGFSRGGITAAGIAYLVTTENLLRSQQIETNADGSPRCCGEAFQDEAVATGCRWLGDHFTVTHNPSTDANSDGSIGYLYYLYCLERVGRLTGRRYFTSQSGKQFDWYRAGAQYLIAHQNPITGAWVGAPALLEDCPILATDYALHFLSRGLTPVLAGKLKWDGAPDAAPDSIDYTPQDVWNLARYTSRLQDWPQQLTWQSVDMNRADAEDLNQCPLLILDVANVNRFTPNQISQLKTYLQDGGCLFALGGCQSASPDAAMQQLISKLYPAGEVELRKLERTHPVYRSEFRLLDLKTGDPLVELWGAETGCRTSIFYSPDDLGCLWDKWTTLSLPNRPRALETSINRTLHVGVNVAALASGRVLIKELGPENVTETASTAERIEHRLLNIAQIRASAEWDAAPHALRKLLRALNQVSGSQFASNPSSVSLSDPRLFKHPLLHLHGRSGFVLSPEDQRILKTHLLQGGVLFADACCGADDFDASFRRLAEQLFPTQKLERIPADHELFSTKTGYDLRQVHFRKPLDLQTDSTEVRVQIVEPVVEGIKVDERYVILYSPCDLSCAIEHGDKITCAGYTETDAIRLGLNIVWYSLLH
ncbi:DUF4159 domain-containing protein [Gimesia sp.]|uniref:DUF4159 domain-containing protein n=1 Tax=Gimesia sp. TaxID=2024833 RepID=UPI000C5ECA9E|nr:DUF4159 domain-containing protein [Gimesia sp.]MAX39609.1 hypothetical protein [Gimesia sp.]